MEISTQESHVDSLPKEQRVVDQTIAPENETLEPFAAPEQADGSSRKAVRDLSGAYSIYRAFK